MTSPAPPAPGTTDGPASFTATYEVSFAEQVRATRYMVRRQPGMWIAYAGIALLASTDALFKIFVHGQWRPDGYTPLIALLALVAAIGLYVDPWVRIRHQRRKYPQAYGPQALTLEETGLRITGPGGSGSLIWSLVPKVAANDQFVFIFLSKTHAQIVPRRALSAAELDAFWWVLGRWAPHLVRHSRAA